MVTAIAALIMQVRAQSCSTSYSIVVCQADPTLGTQFGWILGLVGIAVSIFIFCSASLIGQWFATRQYRQLYLQRMAELMRLQYGSPLPEETIESHLLAVDYAYSETWGAAQNSGNPDYWDVASGSLPDAAKVSTLPLFYLRQFEPFNRFPQKRAHHSGAGFAIASIAGMTVMALLFAGTVSAVAIGGVSSPDTVSSAVPPAGSLTPYATPTPYAPDPDYKPFAGASDVTALKDVWAKAIAYNEVKAKPIKTYAARERASFEPLRVAIDNWIARSEEVDWTFPIPGKYPGEAAVVEFNAALKGWAQAHTDSIDLVEGCADGSIKAAKCSARLKESRKTLKAAAERANAAWDVIDAATDRG